jgi:hypothetical protein
MLPLFETGIGMNQVIAYAFYKRWVYIAQGNGITPMTFTVLTTLSELDTYWQHTWHHVAETSPYHLPTYLAANKHVLVAIWDSPALKVWHPVVLNPIPDTSAWDAQSPYGLSGPLTQGSAAGKTQLAMFWQEWQQYCQQHTIWCELIRFNPLLGNHTDWQHLVTLVNPKGTVCVHPDSRYHARLKRGIRQATNTGLTALYNDWSDWPCFIAQYHQLMQAKQTDAVYFFDQAVWDSLMTLIHAGHGFFQSIRHDGVCLGGAIFLLGNGCGYYHVGAISPKGKALKGSPFSLAHGIAYAQQLGATTVMLGGGLQANDSLQAFKQQFAHQAPLHPYWIGTVIHKPDDYVAYKTRWMATHHASAERLFFYQ